MSKKLLSTIVLLAALAGGYLYAFSEPALRKAEKAPDFTTELLKPKFDFLSRNGNSTCSASFLNSVSSMPDAARLQGSCCSPMSLHRYVEQIKALRKFRVWNFSDGCGGEADHVQHA